jgi:glycosyltransferase involved in cell wall biosynthesis
MRVLCLTVGPDSEPSSRFRIHQWVEPLRASGIEVEIRPRASRRYLELGYGVRTLPGPARAGWAALQFARVCLRRLRDLWDARRYDLLLLQKETFPFGMACLLSLFGLRPVFDFDDAIYLRPDLAYGMGRWLRTLADALARRDRALPALLARCHSVLAGSPNLAAYARAHCERVRLLPTVVETRTYPVRPVRRTGPLTIGWIGAPPNVVYLEPLRPVLKKLAERFPLRLLLLGPPHFECPGVEVRCRPWMHYATVEDEANHLHEFDIGLMPLRNDAFAAGKCALKAIQYMACGIPVVASPVGVNTEVVRDGVCGYLANSPDEWYERLCALLTDPDLRQRLGEAGRARAEARYSVRAALPVLVEALREAAAAQPGKRRTRASTISSTACAREKLPVLIERS